MFKLILAGLVFVASCNAAISSLQLVLADDPYSVTTASKSSANALGNAIPSSEEDITSRTLSEESNESTANSSSSQSPALAPTTTPTNAVSSSPAAISRVKPSSAASATIGLTRGSLLISSSAQASATANSPSSAVTLARSTATIQHRILPAETIPLPIKISTRPGLRTVIAPETITVQQPGIAKVGEIIQQIPTSVSHQRQTVVHNHARIVTPIVAPAVRTETSQIVRAYHTPLFYAPHIVEN